MTHDTRHSMTPSGYGTASHRRIPDNRELPEHDLRRYGGWRVVAVSCVLLGAAVVVLASALTVHSPREDQVSPAPVLLSNMASLSTMARDATDSMISVDERAARTTALDSSSNLKPIVDPFPGWKYNVFDPDNRSMPHHRWSKRRLRQEAKRLIELVTEAQSWQKHKYQTEIHASKNTSEWLSEAVGNISKIDAEANAHMHVIYKGLRVAEAGIEGAIGTTSKMEDEMDYNEDKKKRAVWAILEMHKGKLDFDKILKEQHDQLMKADIYQTENVDTVTLNRYTDKVVAAQKVIDDRIEGLRGRIDANISTFKQLSLENFHRLDNFSAQVQIHVDQMYTNAMRLRSETLDVANKTATYSKSVEILGKEISAGQKGVQSENTNARSLTHALRNLDSLINSTQQSHHVQIQALEDEFGGLKERLTMLIKTLAVVQAAMVEEQAAHSALVQHEAHEMSKWKDIVSNIEPQVKNILDLSSSISTLKIDTASKIGTVSASLQAFENSKNKTALEEQILTQNLAALLKAVNEQTAFAQADSIAAGYKDLDKATSPLDAKIALVQNLRDTINNLGVTLTLSSTNLTQQVKMLSESRKQWHEETKSLHAKLDEKVNTEITREQVEIAATQKLLKTVADKIMAAKNFKEHIMDVHVQLRQELADTTQSLVVLDQKYSDLYAKFGEKLVDMQAAARAMAKPEEMTVASDRVGIEAEQSLDSIKDVRSDAGQLKTTEAGNRAKLEAYSARIKSLKADIGEALQKAKDLLRRHPNMFERISCVCYDGDVLNGRCIAGSLADASTCDICPAGSWCVRGVARPCKTGCPGGQVLKGICPAGSALDATTCVPSPAGFYSENGVAFACRSTCEPGNELRGSCPAGSDHDRTRCAHCPAGFFCQNGVASACKTTCDDGFILSGKCLRGESEDKTVCESCLAGYYASGGVAIPCKTTCPDGQYLLDQCPTGSTQDTSSCVECPDGHYCKGGKAFKCKDTCADGEEFTGQCPAGSTEDVTVCTRCPEGSFCKDGKVFECKKSCPGGQELMGRCRKGSTDDTTTCQPCKADFFCANGVSTACAQECQPGLTLVGKCEAGSPSDTTICKPCPENHYCEGTQVMPCKDRCWEGKILNGRCGEGSNSDTTTCDICPANYYCTRGIAYECKSQCEDGALLIGVCKERSSYDTTSCEPCPARSFCKGGKIETCKTTCSDGELLQGFCKAGSSFDSTECVPCPHGSFCIDGKAKECLKTCPSGQILQGECKEGSSDIVSTCEVCPAGSFCRGGKEEKCRTSCPAGQYLDGACEEGSARDKVTCKECPADSFCEDGQIKPCKEKCPNGQILDGECKRGSESDTTTCSECPSGMFCFNGLVFPCKTSCPLGEELIGTCAAGSESDTTECIPCPSQNFCRDGVATPCRTSCPDGHKIDSECPAGSEVNAQCKPCRAGVFCAGRQEKPCKATCGPGQVLEGFCPAGSAADVTTCSPVQEGSFAVNGLATLCTSMCPPGQFLTGSCPAGSSEDGKTCVPCPEGQWCSDGVATPCIVKCPNGKMLSGSCAEGSVSDTVICEPCPAGKFCADGEVAACKTGCPDGMFLEGECPVASAEDNTHCTPCPAGVFCKNDIQTACTSTCPAGQELVGFCAAGSTEDTISCDPCPAGNFCKDGKRFLCKTSCDDGELFEGACPEGSIEDTTTCSICPEGFFCQEGMKKECRTGCPEKTIMQGTCIAGSVTDTIQCVSDGLPQPFAIKWYKERTGAEAVDEMLLSGNSDMLGAETRLVCASCGKGFLMGRRAMPLTGAKWLVQWYVAWPKYDARVHSDPGRPTFPAQSYGREVSDDITATMNGVVINMPAKKLGKMEFFTHEFEGDELAYRFDFMSQTPEVSARPFIVSGEITLLRDATTGDEGAGVGASAGGSIFGVVMNAIDGKKIQKGRPMNDGFEKDGLKVTEYPSVSIFVATKLVLKVPIKQSKFDVELADGKYTCLATMPGTQAYYDNTCDVRGQKLRKDIIMSPFLSPGMVRVVLSWGGGVEDLDAFMLAPHAAVTDPPCEVNWSNRGCSSNSVELDKDDKNGFGPETITIHQIHEGRYRYRVSEFRGDTMDNSARLKLSQAYVAVYTMGGFSEYQVELDGFIKGNNWYVFVIDSNGKIQPCNEDICGHGYHDPKVAAK